MVVGVACCYYVGCCVMYFCDYAWLGPVVGWRYSLLACALGC